MAQEHHTSDDKKKTTKLEETVLLVRVGTAVVDTDTPAATAGLFWLLSQEPMSLQLLLLWIRADLD